MTARSYEVTANGLSFDGVTGEWSHIPASWKQNAQAILNQLDDNQRLASQKFSLAAIQAFRDIDPASYEAIRRVWDFVQSKKLLLEMLGHEGSLSGEDLARFIHDVFGFDVEVVIKSRKEGDGCNSTDGGKQVQEGLPQDISGGSESGSGNT